MTPTIKQTLTAVAFSFLALPLVHAGTPEDVYPTPQVVKSAKSATIDASKLASSSYAKNPNIKNVLQPVLKAAKIKAAGKIPVIEEKSVSKVNHEFHAYKIEDVPGAYLLKINPSKIEIFAKDATGVFYAAQTLARMIEIDGKIAVCEIADWPDVPFRGSVEGYYGRPWTPDARISQFEFYGKYKMNTYIYGPKDDPYHHAKWWEPYPKETAELLKKQIKAAHDNHVDFVWAAHVGSIITNPNNAAENMKRLVEKFEIMYGLGVRSFGVFFDDIFVHNAQLQAEVCNYVVENFLAKKDDVSPLIMCPSQYNRGWSGGDYLDVIGEKLHPSVRVMWTGNSVCTDITKDTVDWVSGRIKRFPYIWWNWPVVDYCPVGLLLGRTYGLAKENKGRYSGFVSNPMDKPEASKVALFGVGDYCWNVDAFDSEKSWKDGIRRIYPDYAEAMQVLANHCSDQGPNGHGYRREESVEFKPVLDKASEEIASGKLSKGTAKQLLSEFKKMEEASKELIAKIPRDNEELWIEVEYWVRTLGKTGKWGEAVTKLAATTDSKKRLEYATEAAKAYNQRERTMAMQAEHADKIGAPHRNPSRVASREVVPFLTKVFQDEWAKLVKQLGGKPGAGAAGEALYKVITDVPAMEKNVAERDKKYVRVKKYEPVTLEPGQYVGIELPEGVYGTYIHLKLENPEASKSGKIEVSKDGKTWEAFNSRNNGQELHNNLDVKRKIRFFRYVNKSGKPLDIKLNEFKFDIPEDAKANSRGAMTDGDPMSFYTISGAETFAAPEGKKLAYVLTDAPVKNIVASKDRTQVTVKPGESGSADIFEIIWK